ncbi:MAG: XdhC family protein [Deltaproteobacteria bacterium]|nr:XdhC family protein [Deltaproteobacteria bacterium]
MKEIYERVVEEWSKSNACVLATIIKQAGPSPRGIGAKCLLTKDGTLLGTIGGGRLEAEVLEKAPEVLKSRMPELMSFHLKGTDVEDTDMLCGGDVEVFLFPVSPEDTGLLSLFKAVLKVHRRGGAGLIATVVEPETWQGDKAPMLFLPREGEQAGSIPEYPELETELKNSAGQLLRQSAPKIHTFSVKGQSLSVFVEPIISNPVLFIFGGGHVSQQIVPLAARVGFAVTVIDDREDFADPRLFPEAQHVVKHGFEDIMDSLPVDSSSFLVIVTRGHRYDKEVLAQALKTNARYVGMIGSKRKRDIIYQKLLEEAFTRDDLARVHSPVGLSIGAETPAEIAVSIVAELIKERAEG